MIDKWFKKDLEQVYEKHQIMVFIDESKDAEFLLKTLGREYTIHNAHKEIDELQVKYLIESKLPSSEKHLIYTNTSRDYLKFIREYCETNGCLEIHSLQNCLYRSNILHTPIRQVSDQQYPWLYQKIFCQIILQEIKIQQQ